jgi:hypothetical protein
LTEVIAWVAGPWAASLCSNWLIVPTIVLLVGLPSIFSTTNDKNMVVVPTPGGIRVGIEFLLYAVAAIAQDSEPSAGEIDTRFKRVTSR